MRIPFFFSPPRFDLAWWWVRCEAVGGACGWVGGLVACGNAWPVRSVRVFWAVGVCRVRTWGNMPGVSCDRRSRDCRGETRPAACGVSEPCVSLRGLRGLPRGVQAWVVLSHIVGILVPACLSSPLSPPVDLKGRSPAIAPTGEAFALVTSYLTGGRAVMSPVRGFQVDRWVQEEFGPQL